MFGAGAKEPEFPVGPGEWPDSLKLSEAQDQRAQNVVHPVLRKRHEAGIQGSNAFPLRRKHRGERAQFRRRLERMPDLGPRAETAEPVTIRQCHYQFRLVVRVALDSLASLERHALLVFTPPSFLPSIPALIPPH